MLLLAALLCSTSANGHPYPNGSHSRDSPPRLSPMVEHLELPRPLRLIRCTGASLSECVRLPLAASFLGACRDGRNAGLIAGVVLPWLTALARKIACWTVPSLLTHSAIVLV